MFMPSPFVLLLLCLSFAFSSEKASADIRLASGEWSPYVGESLEQGGFISHLVSESFAQSGMEVRWDYLPWKRAYEMTRMGDYGGTFLWRYSAKRAQEFYFSDPLIETQAVMFHRKGLDFEWKNDASLLGHRIGGTIGYHYQFSQIKGINIDWVDSDYTNMKKLVRGRIDLFAVDMAVGYHLLRTRIDKQDATQITHSEWQQGEPVSYHLMLPRRLEGSKRLLDRFNRGLAQLQKSGRYQAIIKAQQRGDYQRIETHHN